MISKKDIWTIIYLWKYLFLYYSLFLKANLNTKYKIFILYIFFDYIIVCCYDNKVSDSRKLFLVAWTSCWMISCKVINFCSYIFTGFQQSSYIVYNYIKYLKTLKNVIISYYYKIFYKVLNFFYKFFVVLIFNFF